MTLSTWPRAAFVPVIPAGGSGTRLWPLSRAHHPKFLVDLTGRGTTLLEDTIARVEMHATHAPIIVTGTKHQEAVRSLVGSSARVLAEPTPRNSMPAIAWAAAVAYRDDPDAVVGSFAADHIIDDVDAFATVLGQARDAAELGYLVTIGIEPTFPATGFGYIEMAPEHTDAALAATGATAVARFVEKPDADRAREFLATGRFAWNAGMFVAKARTILEALDRLDPALSTAARTLAESEADGCTTPIDPEVWESMTAIAIDHALAEPLADAGQVVTVRATFDWDDVGDYKALGAQMRRVSHDASRVQAIEEDGSDVRVLGAATVLAHQAHGTVYSDSERPVVLVGVDGVSVVETPDALLVVADERAQEMSAFVKSLRARGMDHLA